MNQHRSMFLVSIIVLCFAQVGWSDIQDADQLAQRFRPYYKFSADNGSSQEPCRPCSWQWFVSHSGLYRGSTLIKSAAELRTNPGAIVSVPDGNILTANSPTGHLKLRPDVDSRVGESWEDVVNTGAGLYAQVEDGGNNLVVLTYWTLFGYNQTTAAAAIGGNHEGDITAVTLIYDRVSDRPVRTYFGMHGQVLESFDLIVPISVGEQDLAGRNVDGQTERVRAKVIRIPKDRQYQDGPAWHSPSIPANVYFTQDPVTKRFEHIAIFCEWGSHEPWPNPNGSVTMAPKHGGDSTSFLPKRVRLLGSFGNPVKEELPFVLFNGCWGEDPKGCIFHRCCFYPEGRSRNHFNIPESAFVDRDPFGEGSLHWPPTTLTRIPHIQITASCYGNRNNAQVAIRWGHPKHDEHEYFPSRKVRANQIVTWDFNCPDRISEFEIQTEGGSGTGYAVKVQIDKGNNAFPGNPPTIQLTHRVEHVQDEHLVNGGVEAVRSSPLNGYGEQNIRIDMDGNTTGTIK